MVVKLKFLNDGYALILLRLHYIIQYIQLYTYHRSRHDIAEILRMLALSTNQSIIYTYQE